MLLVISWHVLITLTISKQFHSVFKLAGIFLLLCLHSSWLLLSRRLRNQKREKRRKNVFLFFHPSLNLFLFSYPSLNLAPRGSSVLSEFFTKYVVRQNTATITPLFGYFRSTSNGSFCLACKKN